MCVAMSKLAGMLIGAMNKHARHNENLDGWRDTFICCIRGFHFRGFLHGSVSSVLGGLVIAGIVSIL